MAGSPITHFDPDPDRLEALRLCTDSYGVGEPDAEWPNNILSRRTVVYGSGRIARRGDSIRHAVDPDELALCRRLAGEAASVMAGVEVGMGSEAGDTFHGFFVAATAGEPVPKSVDEALIRSRFGGTIFPPATITVEPLAEGGVWWGEVEADGADSGDEFFGPWRAMIAWFCEQSEFVDAVFVRIGDSHEL